MQLGVTHALVILLSRGWLASNWCQRELEIFSRCHPDAKGRIFVVELDSINSKEKPDALSDLLTYRFWKKTDHDTSSSALQNMTMMNYSRFHRHCSSQDCSGLNLCNF
jgi:hypothetical protein